jgi:type VI secretion system secreted protein VgrG
VCHFDEGDIADEHHVSRFTRERSVRPQATLLRDYDFRQPRLDLSAARSTRAVPPRPDRGDSTGTSRTCSATGSSGRWCGARWRAAVTLDPRRATVYEHHGEDDDPEVTRTAAQVRFEQVRRRAIVASGASWCRRVGAGQRFVLDGHDDASLNGEYALTEVRHVGRTGPRVRGDRARGRVSERVLVRARGGGDRPPPVPRVHRQVLETATVVGPPGEEIYTDHHGRVKVQFHWDLAGRGDERSSCWVRVNQTWGGASWGTQFIPRVGMEVIVSFLGGDQDRPVVLGCLYNGENTAPFVLPGDRTRSGIRTRARRGATGTTS